MTEKIAIFDNEEGVLDAIRMLREAGAEQDDFRVIVNNREGAPMLSSEDHLQMEELYELQLTRGDETDADTMIVAPTFLPGGFTSNVSGTSAGILITPGFEGEMPDSSELLSKIGIPYESADRCAKAIEGGKYLLVTDTEAGINAEGLLSRAGATDIIG